MTRRERIQARADRRLAWSESRAAKATAADAAADSLSQRFEGGQPILVGHHSEKRARRDQDRVHASMAKASEHAQMAKHHAARASGLQLQLDRSIYSDDPDAVEQLRKRIADNEQQAADFTALNKAWRKGGAEALRGLTLPSGKVLGDKVAEACAKLGEQPIAAYQLTNLRASIRRDKQRLAELTAKERA